MDQEISLKEAEELLQIDKTKLDEHCMTQSSIFFAISNVQVKKMAIRDELKDNLTKAFALISSHYRQEADTSGQKVTEAKLNQMVQTDPQYLEISKEYLQAKEEADLWSAMKESFTQRASMIKLLCELYASNYFSEISVKDNRQTGERGYRAARRMSAESRRSRSGDDTKK